MLNIEYLPNEDVAFIDSGTCKYLELIGNNSKSHKNLFHLLNYCETKNGMKLLRSNILEPPIAVDVVLERIEAIEYALKEKDFFVELQNILKQFNGIDEILKYFYQTTAAKSQNLKSNEKKFKIIYLIKQELNSIYALLNMLKGTESSLFENIYKVNYILELNLSFKYSIIINK